MERRPLIIVGSGPAGCATALYLERLDPALARDVLVLDKAEHPREKVCAGGLIPHTLDCLRELDIPLAVPHVTVDDAEVLVPGARVAYRGRDLCRVIRRSAFDAHLAEVCRSRGIEVRGGERVVDVGRENGGVRVETDRGSYRADAVIGADGSGSIVRRKLLGGGTAHTGRAVMCDVPVRETSWSGHEERRYDFNFLPVAEKLRGYAWAFPCLIGGEPHVNIGVYSVHMEGAYLRDLLERETARLGTRVPRVQAFPIHWYRHGAPIAGPGAMLVGDAAGVDPLMGEGISFCFEYGRLAATALASRRPSAEAPFAAYQQAVRSSWMGRKLRRLGLATRLFYGPTRRVWFGVASRSRRAQEIGIRWYNGVDGVDRLSLWQGLRLLRRLGKHQQVAPAP
jgi:flavin-dependent dehydrogenase